MSGSTTGIDLPIVMTTAGVQPQSPALLQTQLLAMVSAAQPGYTANLPGSLIDDVSGTCIAAVALCDQARVALINALTPYGANEFILNQLGQIYGVIRGQDTSTSVYLVFSGPAGFVIGAGFVVSDGSYQYVVQDGGVINTGLTSAPIYAIANQTGSWPVPANSVNQLVTSIPTSIVVTCTNPLAGTPGGAIETLADYRSDVLTAGKAVSQGMTTTLKTMLTNVTGVQNRLVSVVQVNGGGWEVLVGGTGDPYAIGNAIFTGLFDISTLVGSTMNITGITNANPGVVTTGLNHGFTTGQVINVTGAAGMTGINSTPLTITVITNTTFSIGINTTSSGTYTGGGVVTPNFRNVIVNIADSPNTYAVPFVVPPLETVSMVITWNTSSTNFISAAAISAAAQPAIANYVNTLPVGQPMNLFELQVTFQTAIANLIPPQLLTRMVFAVAINGIGVSPSSGTGIIAGDPESYFSTINSSIIVNQG